MAILWNNKGVTVVELLIVIVVLGIISAFAVVSVGAIIENTKQNGDEVVLSNINEATRLMLYGLYDTDDVFDGYDTDEDKLNYMVSEGFLSAYPEPLIDTSSFAYNVGTQLWTLNGTEGSVIYSETSEEFFTYSGSKITSYDTTGGLSIVIPSSIDGNAITELGQDSFRDLAKLSRNLPPSRIY